MENRINKRKTMTGVVMSDKMMKTRVVQVMQTQRHAKYGKLMKIFTRFKAHDEKNESRTGDTVVIQETRPLSKDKRWVIIHVAPRTNVSEVAL